MNLLPYDEFVTDYLAQSFDHICLSCFLIPKKNLRRRYAENKWSVKEILLQIVGDERIFNYLALKFARNKKADLIAFDLDASVPYSEAEAKNLDSFLDEYEAVKKASIALYPHLPENAPDRIGHASGSVNDASVCTLVYHIAGHEQHHLI